ncbi:DUF3631 domain-containing protein [Arthrobacter sp. NPDC090010]|uniref:DUF3631 domain-containing protein n=1 Tax=Arthrobacter sp. NPDC090010 TaxID=3363942 RepID=UPI00380CDA97
MTETKTDSTTSDGSSGSDRGGALTPSSAASSLSSTASTGSILGEVLNRTREWFGTYIRVADDLDLDLLALWTVHTHLAAVSYSTPRLQIDSAMPGAGKTTVLEHLNRLAYEPVQAASVSSPALLARLVAGGIRTILIDEVDRSLNPKKPGVEDLIAIINSGYKKGATRPVLVPVQGGNWDVKEMSTYSPVAMAGNSPQLPDDTRSRCIRVLLIPDFKGEASESDWEVIEPDAFDLAETIRQAVEQVSDDVRTARPALPEKCVGRMKEKWNPLRRIAEVAGGDWPAMCDVLIERDIEETEMEREEGLAKLPPAVILLKDLSEVWGDTDFRKTTSLVTELALHNPEMWGMNSAYGKALTTQRMGRMLMQAYKINSVKLPDGDRPRGYRRTAFTQLWDQFDLEPSKETGRTGPSVRTDRREGAA